MTKSSAPRAGGAERVGHHHHEPQAHTRRNGNASIPRNAFEAFREALVYRLTANRDLPGSALRVAIVLAMHINRETYLAEKIAEAWPGEETIARLAGYGQDRRHLDRDINELKGIIEVIPGKRGRGKTSRYRFRLGPWNAQEYTKYCRAWLDKASTQDEIQTRWDRETDMRRRCGVVGGDLEDLMELIVQYCPQEIPC